MQQLEHYLARALRILDTSEDPYFNELKDILSSQISVAFPNACLDAANPRVQLEPAVFAYFTLDY